MMKKLSMALAIALVSMAARAQKPGAETIIRQQPAGTLHDNYARSSYYFYTSYSGVLYGLDLWSTSRYVEGNDGCVYLYNPFSQLPTRTWLKLDPAGNGKYVAHLPQAIREGETYDEEGNLTKKVYYAFPVKEYETSEGEPFCKIDTLANGTVKNEISFVLRNDSLIMTDDNYIGLMTEQMKWTGYADTDIKVGKVKYKANTLPKDIALQDYRLSYQTKTGGNEQKIVKMAFDNDGKVYLLNPYNNSTSEVIIGTYDGNKTVNFPTRQYLGPDWATTHHLFFMARGYEREGQQINYSDWYDSFKMTVDGDKKTLNPQASSVIIINAGDSLKYALSYYFDPTLTRYEDLSLTPSAPIIDTMSVQPCTEGAPGFISFFFDRYDEAGNLFDNTKYYYRLYADDDTTPYTFTDDNYVNVSTPMTEVPVNFVDYIDFFIYTLQGNDKQLERSVNIYDGSVARWGVQMVYKGGNKDTVSPISWWNVPTTAINAVTSPTKKIVGTEYYDLSGRRLNGRGDGLNIKVTIFSDGTRRVTKLQGK